MAWSRPGRDRQFRGVLRPSVKREVTPVKLKLRAEMECTSERGVDLTGTRSAPQRMGRDPMSVVDGSLKVYGCDKLRVADASIDASDNDRQHDGAVRRDR